MAIALHRTVAIVVATLAASVSSLAGAQSASGRAGALEVRAFMPGLHHVEHGAQPERSRSRLTTEERIETTLRDRERGALRSAGEAADVRPPRAAPTTTTAGPSVIEPTPMASGRRETSS